jgi:hypothetical protein
MDASKRSNLWRAMIGFMSLMILQWYAPFVKADGNETLGPPSVTIASGTRMITAGVGLSLSQPGDIEFTVPAGATVEQVLLYWHGYQNDGEGVGDAEITVNGTAVTGTLIGGPLDLNSSDASAYRADITALGAVSAGANTLTIGDMDFNKVNHGAGVLVIITENVSVAAHIDVRDGNDYAYAPRPAPQDSTVPQVFNFAASMEDRTATIDMHFASIAGIASSGDEGIFRPSAIAITVGNESPVIYDNLLGSFDGEEWDSLSIDVDVPAGVTQIIVEAQSVDNGAPVPEGYLEENRAQEASLHWIAAGLSITPQAVPGRMTGGGHQIRIDGARITRGFTIHCDIRLSNNIEVNWPGGNKWHLSKPITSAVCIDDAAVSPFPPAAPFDTFIGEGVGELNGVEGSIIRFTFVDAGEPGRNDTAWIRIWAPGVDPDGGTSPVLEVEGTLDGGNIQAHYDQPHS